MHPRASSQRCWTDASQGATLLQHRLHRHGVGCDTVDRRQAMDRVAPDLIRHRRALYRARAPLPGHAPSAMADDSPPHMVPATHPEPHHDGPLDRACVHARSGRLRRPGRGLRFRNRSQPKPETRPCSENPLNAKPRPHRRIGADPDRRSQGGGYLIRARGRCHVFVRPTSPTSEQLQL